MATYIISVLEFFGGLIGDLLCAAANLFAKKVRCVKYSSIPSKL